MIHAGDFTHSGQASQIQDFNQWLGELPHQHKLVVAGNHDFLFEREPALARELLSHANYLEDSGVSIAGVRFWGSPVSPRFFNWAFNRVRGAEIAKHWQMIPSDTQVLIVHTPPHGILDRLWSGQSVGCEALIQTIQARLNLSLLICGHIHEGRGAIRQNETLYVNAAVLDRRYQPAHAVWVIDYQPDSGLATLCVGEGD